MGVTSNIHRILYPLPPEAFSLALETVCFQHPGDTSSIPTAQWWPLIEIASHFQHPWDALSVPIPWVGLMSRSIVLPTSGRILYLFPPRVGGLSSGGLLDFQHPVDASSISIHLAIHLASFFQHPTDSLSIVTRPAMRRPTVSAGSSNIRRILCLLSPSPEATSPHSGKRGLSQSLHPYHTTVNFSAKWRNAQRPMP